MFTACTNAAWIIGSAVCKFAEGPHLVPPSSCRCRRRVMNTEQQLFVQNESLAVFCFSSFVKLMESTALLKMLIVVAKVKNSASLSARPRFVFGSDVPHCQ